ncbi:hypothetical protein O9929_14805 [Vibrio lentus]|nr:hypothetical protein [Vibrio lentus]
MALDAAIEAARAGRSRSRVLL